jgi:hypothetical protein
VLQLIARGGGGPASRRSAQAEWRFPSIVALC